MFRNFFQRKTRPSLINSLSFRFCVADYLKNIRNIGISAHIDSGKTTFSERVLFYAGKITQIHEVKGKDNVGATMDFMELERERGITIQSAATFLTWKDCNINLIDTPGHVDFTIEVERALRVLDGGVMIVCGVAGVQPQTLTVNKQMIRYSVPRIIFINKLDRNGANPWTAIKSLQEKLGLNCAAVQVPIGQDNHFKGVVDLLKMKAFYYEGQNGETIREDEIPVGMKELCDEKKAILIEQVSSVDPELEERFINEEEITGEMLKDAIRRQTLGLKFIPVFMGSAYKNKGVQAALDGVLDYLPAPHEMVNKGYIMNPQTKQEEEIIMESDPKKEFIGYAFKLEENKFGQLTYVRCYQGKLKRSEYIYNSTSRKKMKVSRMVKMHANKMEDVEEVKAGEIFAIFGLECSTGDSLLAGNYTNVVTCSSIFVPEAVVSMTLVASKEDSEKLNKALSKFQREDPTFKVNFDEESEEIIISGMGELHLQIYAERIRREYNVKCDLIAPTVNYRESIESRQYFDYLHKKQTGGAGQYARVIGYIEPLPKAVNLLKKHDQDFSNQFVNEIVGTSIPNEYIGAIEKAFYDCVNKYVLQDGATHPVDSSSNAFGLATKYSFSQVFNKGKGVILEPLMSVEVSVPIDNYVHLLIKTAAMASISRRRGLVTTTETRGDSFFIGGDVPLSQMFGYATELRGMTSGLGEFSMEYKCHQPIMENEAEIVRRKFQLKKKDNN